MEILLASFLFLHSNGYKCPTQIVLKWVEFIQYCRNKAMKLSHLVNTYPFFWLQYKVYFRKYNNIHTTPSLFTQTSHHTSLRKLFSLITEKSGTEACWSGWRQNGRGNDKTLMVKNKQTNKRNGIGVGRKHAFMRLWHYLSGWVGFAPVILKA